MAVYNYTSANLRKHRYKDSAAPQQAAPTAQAQPAFLPKCRVCTPVTLVPP